MDTNTIARLPDPRFHVIADSGESLAQKAIPPLRSLPL
jgi:hypothetical protein